MYRTENKLKLDIIISGYTEDKESLSLVINNLQKQLDEINRTDISVLYSLCSKEATNQDAVLQHAIEQHSYSEYYVVLNCKESFYVMPNYIRGIIDLIEKNENPNMEEVLKHHGINKTP
jgi:hypothetical protein